MQDQIKHLLAQKSEVESKLNTKIKGPHGLFHFTFNNDGILITTQTNIGSGSKSEFSFRFEEIERLKQFLNQFDTNTIESGPILKEFKPKIKPKINSSSIAWQRRKKLEYEIRDIWSQITNSGDPSILRGRSLKDFMEKHASIIGKKNKIILYKLNNSEVKPLLKELKKVKLL